MLLGYYNGHNLVKLIGPPYLATPKLTAWIRNRLKGEPHEP
jgi:hypothetical protein